MLRAGNDAILVNSKRGCSNQTRRKTDRDGKGSIFSVSKAVCMERKWVHSASMMFITRLHISPILAFLEARDRIYCFVSQLRSSRLKRNSTRCLKQIYAYIQIMKHCRLADIRQLILVLNDPVWETNTPLQWFYAIFMDHWAKMCPILVNYCR